MDFEFYLYIGSKNMCDMIAVGDSNLFLYDKNTLFINYDNDNLLKSQNKLNSLDALGTEYKDVFITYNPSYEVDFFSKNLFSNESIEYDNFNWLRFPLIKVKDDNGSFFCSGKRSAIIRDKKTNNYIRLKGCGNLFSGFIKGNVSELGGSHYEIFGTQFKNTCLKELFITEKLKNKLKDFDFCFDIGNEVLGWWKYPNNVNYGDINANLKNEYSLIDKYCGIFKTTSDRRLGEHFFKGVNLILSALFSNEMFTNDFFNLLNLNNVKSLLPSKNFNEKKILFNDMILMDDSYNENLLFDLFSYLNTLNLSNINEIQISILQDMVNKTIKESNNPYTKLFSKDIISLCNSFKSTSVSVIYLIIGILSKIGYECGRIKKIMALIELNWGTYDYHSNSHLDNFLIIPLNNKKNYLSPLDFDLAFFKEDFINLKYLKNIDDSKIFDDLINVENNNLRIQLAGINPIVNIDVELFSFNTIYKGEFTNCIESFRNLLIENINHYYNIGFKQEGADKIKHLDLSYLNGCQLIKMMFALLDG